MKVWGRYDGGPVEGFASLHDARMSFQHRVGPSLEDVMLIYFRDPLVVRHGPSYPDRLLQIGPRGGTVLRRT